MKLLAAVVLGLLADIAYGQHFLKHKHGIPQARSPKANAKSPVSGWISQRLDHFNPTDLRTWYNNYYSNDQFYEEGGPIFIFLGGDWELSPQWLQSGLMFDMAAELKGHMFHTEHRYYGLSFPLDDLSTENLQFLSMDQAIADVAYFIQYQKKIIPGAKNSKVIVVGGSYAGKMATWLRKKYPHLVDVAWASSAPLKAVADFHEFFQFVYDNLKSATPSCSETITEAIRTIEENLETAEGLSTNSQLFNTCGPIDVTEPERSHFFSYVAYPFGSMVQYANPGGLDSICNNLLSYSGTPVEKVGKVVRGFYSGMCMTDFKYLIFSYNHTFLTVNPDRQRFYQSCTEYGSYQTGGQDGRPFGDFNIDMYIDACEQLFGTGIDVLNAGVKRTNLFYGEQQPEVTHVVSVHGTVDPWHILGVFEDINPLAPVIVINGTSHSADLYSIGNYDPPELRDAKLRVKALIAEWIQA